jgi:pyrimidine-specific ribonucleoside hydrolase
MKTNKRKVIFDCDPGLDDALALLLAIASDELDVLAITTVAGNSTIENTTQNALDLLEFFGRSDIAVARGNANPILGNFSLGAHVHGQRGIGNASLKPSTAKEHPLRAHDLIRKLLMESEDKITIIATGPLTNIGLAISLYPEIIEKIEMISMMGGSYNVGNIGAVTEANAGNDPEAAHVVLSCGVPIAMFGLHLTYATQIMPEDMDRIEAIGGEFAKTIADFNRFHFQFYKNDLNFEGDPSHDSCAVAYLINPDIFTMAKLNVVMDLDGKYSRGQTVVDTYNVTLREPNVLFGLKSDREAFVELVYQSVKKLAKALN